MSYDYGENTYHTQDNILMGSKLNRETIVGMWVCSGIKDFCISFHIENKFPSYATFFYHQGLEKICKAYFLGTKASAYEPLHGQKAREEVDKIAKDMGHNIEEMINNLVVINVLDKNILRKKYGDYDGQDITGIKCIKILEKAYAECRYPVPNPVYKNYPLLNKKGQKIGYWDLIASSEPKKFAYDVGLELIKRIEMDFNMTIPRSKFSTSIEDEDWERFRRLFFKDI